jgi:hypothetical protein
MPKKKLTREEQIKSEVAYVAFLKKRLDSAHYRESVTDEEYAKTKKKYESAKFRLKMMQ